MWKPEYDINQFWLNWFCNVFQDSTVIIAFLFTIAGALTIIICGIMSVRVSKKIGDTVIESSVAAVEKGMVIADKTATQLEEVADSSKAITEQVNGIAEALETQTNAINEVNKGVEQISILFTIYYRKYIIKTPGSNSGSFRSIWRYHR